jgi:hypothetical protein
MSRRGDNQAADEDGEQDPDHGFSDAGCFKWY